MHDIHMLQKGQSQDLGVGGVGGDFFAIEYQSIDQIIGFAFQRQLEPFIESVVFFL
jgi:hypothetical protein